MPAEPVQYQNVTIETVDQAVRDWFDRSVDSHVESPTGDRKKVPVIFSSGERWVTAAEKRGIRDTNGVLILPLITVRRTGIEPVASMTSFGVELPNIKIAKRISPKTSQVKNTMTNRPPGRRREGAIYEVTTIPFPDFSVLTYEIMIQTQYIVQMNSVVEKIFHELDLQKSFVMPIDNRDRHAPIGEEFEDRKPFDGGYFVGFLDSTMPDGGNFEEFTDQERIVKYTAGIRVPTYLQLDPEGEKPSIKVERTAFGLDFGDESVCFVEDPEELDRIFNLRVFELKK